MKKIIALLLAAIMLLGLAACSAKTESTGQEPAAEEATTEASSEAAPADAAADGSLPYEGVVLKYWFPPFTGEDQSYWDDRFAQFEAETGAKVEVTIVPWGEMGTKYMSGFMSDAGPDVFYMISGLMFDIVDAGIALDLDPYYTEEEKADQLFWSAGNCLGGQYASPFAAGVSFRGLCFNMDLLKAAGVDAVPTTTTELIEAAQKIKDANVCEYPVLYPATNDSAAMLCSLLPTMYSHGGQWISDDGEKCLLNSEENLAALQYLYDLVYTYEVMPKDVTSLNAQAGLDLFAEGKVAIVATEPGYVMGQEYPFEWTASIGVSDGTHPVRTVSPLDMMSVNANSENVEAAVALLKWVTTAEQRDNFRETNYPTLAQMNASAAPITYDVPSIAACMEQMGEVGLTNPICRGAASMDEILYTNFQLMMMDELTPQEALDAMQRGCDAALAG